MSLADRLPEGLRTLKFRLMLLISVVLIVVVGLPVGLFVHHLDKNYEEFSTTMLDITTLFVYQHLYDGLMANDSLRIQQNLELLSTDPRIRLVRIRRPEGTILYSTQPEEIRRSVAEVGGSPAGVITRSDDAIMTRAGNTYAYQHPIYVEQACTGCHEQEGATIGYMDVVANFTDSAQIYTYAKQLSVTGGILIIIVLWLAMNLLYEGQIERRLRRFIDGFDALAAGKLDAQIHMNGRHELATLATRFNDTVHTLQSARKREEQFYQERLERADRLVTLGEIAAEIAHEVNNPVGIIRSRAELVQDEIGDRDPSSPYREDIDMIVQQTERIADITRSILHYARKNPRCFDKTDIGAVIRHAVKILGPHLKKRRVELALNLPDQPALIWGDFSQLEQVFCNLINNSVDAFDGAEGHIDITVECVPGPAESTLYRIIYTDDGPGIPDELRKQVFSPFFTTKKDGKGTGLGLFIARNIIDAHRGNLRLDEDYRNGARFIMDLEQIYA